MQDCDETVQARLKSRMAARGVDLVMHPWVKGQDAHQIVVVSCLAASARLATDVSRALENIGSELTQLLVLLPYLHYVQHFTYTVACYACKQQKSVIRIIQFSVLVYSFILLA